MGNLFGAFQSEVFRPFATLLIPGSFAVVTWFVGLLSAVPRIKHLVSANHAETGWILAICVTCAGLVIEDIGARYETSLDEKAGPKHREEWYLYLRTTYVADPIGRRYLRALVLRLKFELGMAVACISCLAGLVWLWWLRMALVPLIALVIVEILGVLFFRAEALETHKTLATTRRELLKGVLVQGRD